MPPWPVSAKPSRPSSICIAALPPCEPISTATEPTTPHTSPWYSYDSEEPVGFAYGAPLAPGFSWWAKIPGLTWDFTHETGTRTFAVSELMVRSRWRKTGTAARLHDELLASRTEARATILVDSSHPKVKALYETWGYTIIGETKPLTDAPLMTAMVRPIR